MKTRLEVIVHGRVQGVGFRWHTAQKARALGLVGSVRNLPDGTVCVVAEGSSRAAEALLVWLSRGPDRAQVDRCEPRWLEPTGAFAHFNVTG
jgi:acylphosphatase